MRLALLSGKVSLGDSVTTISAGGGIAMVSFSLSKGLSMTEIRDVTGVSVQDLLHLNKRLPEEILVRLWAHLGKRFPGEPLTFEMARAAPFSFFGGLAEGAQYADDLRSAIMLFAKNPALIAGKLKLRFIETSTSARLTSSQPLDCIDGGRSAEIVAALAARMFSEFLGVENAIQGAKMAHAPLTDEKHYVNFFGGPVEFNATETGILFHPEKLDTKIEHAHTELFSYVKTHFSIMQKQILVPYEDEKLFFLKTAAVESVALGVPTTIGVAAAANMSLRTAQRVAAQNGTTLQHLISNALANRAKEFLADQNLDVASISLLLGYSDDRAFRRAFRNWTGQTPSEYRRSLKT